MAGDSGSNAAHHPDDGDERGIDWEFVYDEHSPRIRRIIERRAGTSITDDLLQETFERALRGESRFNLERPMAPWLNTIAFRLTSDVRRQRTSSGELLVDEPPDIVGPDVAEEAYIARIRRIGIRQALEGLNHRHRRVLEMIAIEGMTSEEVAEFEHMTTEAVKSVLARARVNFRANYTAFVEKMGIFGGAVVGPMVVRLRARLERYGELATNSTGIVTVAAVVTAFVSIATVPATRPDVTKAREEVVVDVSRGTHVATVTVEASSPDNGSSPAGNDPSPSQQRVSAGADDSRSAPEQQTVTTQTGAGRQGQGAEAGFRVDNSGPSASGRTYGGIRVSDCEANVGTQAECAAIDVVSSLPTG